MVVLGQRNEFVGRLRGKGIRGGTVQVLFVVLVLVPVPVPVLVLGLLVWVRVLAAFGLCLSQNPPLVTLRLGSTLTPDDIKEGDDVYFECHVQSNPQWRKLLWLHNGIHLEHNTSARVIRSNQSLVLQKITKHYAGNYACSAINDEGETVSNQLPLRVKYASPDEEDGDDDDDDEDEDDCNESGALALALPLPLLLA
uniref:HDC02590 n=1 Tax=Drosophila melanogaster TaxID=7227 RepID=Q6IHH0_DROME|nr:TPA_inf: HDC02590 [Drosophila melanogaster]